MYTLEEVKRMLKDMDILSNKEAESDYAKELDLVLFFRGKQQAYEMALNLLNKVKEGETR